MMIFRTNSLSATLSASNSGNGALTGFAGCSEIISKLSTTDESTLSSSPAAELPDVSERLTPVTGTVPVEAGESYDSWFYDKQYPGPELRVKERERQIGRAHV